MNIKSVLQKHDFFEIENEQDALYIKLYNALKNAILKRSLSPNTKLPATRILARDLEISRATVVSSYNLLVLEDYVKSVRGSGYYVCSPRNKKIHHNITCQSEKINYAPLSRIGEHFKKNFNIISKKENKGIAFRPGLPPLDLFPVHTWKRLTADYWRSIKHSELSYSNPQGLLCLRENIADYLKVYRNIDCSAEQIIVTSGSLHSLSLISSIMVNKGDEVVVENPIYPQAYRVFKSLGAKIHALDVDDEGIDLNQEKSNNPKFIYSTPSSQYPLGTKMSMPRRSDILKWASKKSAFIIEDDYDHEFSNWEKPLASLHSLDNEDRVVYLGTFNKLLHPSLRLGYMIVPHYLLDSAIGLYEQSTRFISPSLQKPMSDFIAKGYLDKHLRNIIEETHERKRQFIKYFSENTTGLQLFNTENTGLQLIAEAPGDFKDTQITKYLKKNEIIAHPLSTYYYNAREKNGLVMGYSSVNSKLIKDNLLKMTRSLEEFGRLNN